MLDPFAYGYMTNAMWVLALSGGFAVAAMQTVGTVVAVVVIPGATASLLTASSLRPYCAG